MWTKGVLTWHIQGALRPRPRSNIEGFPYPHAVVRTGDMYIAHPLEYPPIYGIVGTPLIDNTYYDMIKTRSGVHEQVILQTCYNRMIPLLLCAFCCGTALLMIAHGDRIPPPPAVLLGV